MAYDYGNIRWLLQLETIHSEAQLAEHPLPPQVAIEEHLFAVGIHRFHTVPLVDLSADGHRDRAPGHAAHVVAAERGPDVDF